jgi:hypothetical protein
MSMDVSSRPILRKEEQKVKPGRTAHLPMRKAWRRVDAHREVRGPALMAAAALDRGGILTGRHEGRVVGDPIFPGGST